MRAELALDPSIDLATSDLNSNLKLLDTNCRKTGDLITLDYEEVDWINQPHATEVENVNPFNVIVFAGVIFLILHLIIGQEQFISIIQDTESTGNTWVEVSNVVSTTSNTLRG